MDVWWNHHVLCSDLESFSWNNHKKTGCLEFQVYIYNLQMVKGMNEPLLGLKLGSWFRDAEIEM